MVDVSAIDCATKYGEEAVAFSEEVLEAARFALVDWACGAVGDIKLYIRTSGAQTLVAKLRLVQNNSFLTCHCGIKIGQMVEITGDPNSYRVACIQAKEVDTWPTFVLYVGANV